MNNFNLVAIIVFSIFILPHGFMDGLRMNSYRELPKKSEYNLINDRDSYGLFDHMTCDQNRVPFLEMVQSPHENKEKYIPKMNIEYDNKLIKIKSNHQVDEKLKCNIHRIIKTLQNIDSVQMEIIGLKDNAYAGYLNLKMNQWNVVKINSITDIYVAYYDNSQLVVRFL